jgi:hypothetical protein
MKHLIDGRGGGQPSALAENCQCRIPPRYHDPAMSHRPRPARIRSLPSSPGETVLRKTFTCKAPARHEASPAHRTWDQCGPAPPWMWPALCAPQGPLLKAGTRRDSALDCHAGLASGTARTLGGARRQFGRRRLQIGHGIDPGKVAIAIILKRDSGAGVPAAVIAHGWDSTTAIVPAMTITNVDICSGARTARSPDTDAAIDYLPIA